ncbi:MAG TPA: (deoxy)nucleoside triphosphate pyrophosphohydrolase [Polyangiaceae bacterium]|nr:(deoxy)nucleoside triphosphate pyrophosphohydrolase [Polyangiaceae bacterium]
MIPGKSDKPTLHIALALIWKDAQLLVTQRPQGVHLAGFWEFPGGKCHAGEAAPACAEREAFEEVAVVCRALGVRSAIRHEYPERIVLLEPVDCAWQSGAPRRLAVADFAWVGPAELARYEFPPANAALIRDIMAGGQK